jgi:hypothetical protein
MIEYLDMKVMFIRVLLGDGRIEFETCTVQIEGYGSGSLDLYGSEILVCRAFFFFLNW